MRDVSAGIRMLFLMVLTIIRRKSAAITGRYITDDPERRRAKIQSGRVPGKRLPVI